MEQQGYPASEPAAPSGSGIFQDANDFEITRSNFTNIQGNMNLHAIPSTVLSLLERERQERHRAMVPRDPSSSQTPIYSESNSYCRQLLRQGRGFPMYIPGPHKNLPVAYRKTGIAIGDVGRITPEGSFDFFFNIYLPASDPINTYIPGDFVPLSPYNPIDVTDFDFDPGNFVSTPSTYAIDGGFSEPIPGGEFVFNCRGPDGAVLALPHGAHLEKLENLENMRRYAAKHAESWYQYVNGARGRGLVNGSLYLITACEKSKSWGMASFHDVPHENEFQISFSPTADEDDGYRYRWHGTRCRYKQADPPLVEGTPVNQTTFIHAFAISLGEGLWGKLFGGVHVSQLADSSALGGASPGGFVPYGPQSSSTWFLGFFSGGSATGANDDTDRSLVQENTTISAVSPIPVLLHPSQVIHETLLRQVPQATVVITHDDDWRDIFKDNDLPMTYSHLQHMMFDRFNIVEEDGTVYLRDKTESVMENDLTAAVGERVAVIEEEDTTTSPRVVPPTAPSSTHILGHFNNTHDIKASNLDTEAVPSDIWRCVAAFLPLVDLLSLCAVNREFFAVFWRITNERQFQSVHFVGYDNTAKRIGAKALMKHVRESALVHSVRIQPWDVQPKSKSKSRFWLALIRNLPHSRVSPISGFKEAVVQAEITRRVKKQTLRVADTIKGFANLHTYRIDWDEEPYHLEFFAAFLHSVIPTVGQRLSTLTLKVPLQYMPSLPRLATSLTKLENLALTIHTGAHITSYISEKMEGLVVFMNGLIRQLRSLSISTTPTSTHLDLQPLFQHLGHGRHLAAFTLCLPFDGGHLADPTSLRLFIINHCHTLESLTLGTTRATVRPVASARASETKFWIRDTMKDPPHFPALSYLSLSLRPLRTDLTPLLQSMAAMRGLPLRVLKLSERPLEYAELVRVLKALGYLPHVRVLSLSLRRLSPEIVDTLAAELPALSALELNFAEVVHQEAASDALTTLSGESYGLSRESELTLFCQMMESKFYPRWNLARLAIPEGPHVRWLDAMEQSFIRCIPTLQSFEELLLPGV